MFEIKELKAWYDIQHMVLNGVNMKFENGEISTILGVNGAGKSTLLRTIVGLHNKYEGSFVKDSQSINPSKSMDFKRSFFYISDEPIILEELHAIDFIKLIHIIYKKKINMSRLEELVEIFEFGKYLNEECKTLSLGNKQKTLIILGFLLDCDILILDEPLIGLDVMAIENFYNEVKNYVKKGNSVIFSTHIIDIVKNISDRVFILDDGYIKDTFKVSDNVNIKERFFGIVKNA